MQKKEKMVWDEFLNRVKPFDIVTPQVVSDRPPITVVEALDRLGAFGKHGALDPVEGAVWHVESYRQIVPRQSKERRWVVDFLVKYVRPDKIDVHYLLELSGNPPVWNRTHLNRGIEE